MLSQSIEDALCRFFRAVRIAISEEDHELALPQTRADVSIVAALAYSLGSAHHDRISGAESSHRDDHLQVIDGDEQHRIVRSVTCEGFVHRVPSAPPIEQPR